MKLLLFNFQYIRILNLNKLLFNYYKYMDSINVKTLYESISNRNQNYVIK